MTTVSVVECVSPVSLRTCGSSVSSLLLNRKRLQSPSSRSVEAIEVDADKEITRTQSAFASDLCVVGSKPRLYGMWEITDSRPITALTCYTPSVPNEDGLFDPIQACDDRMCGTTPDNPPPSLTNSMSDIEGFVMDGHKLMCPERVEPGHNRDFNPGFVKQPQYHCVKCQGRIFEEEMSQITLQRRVSSIISRHTSKHNVSAYAMNDCKDHHIEHQFMTPRLSDTYDCTTLDEKSSFYEIYAEKKRLKAEKERLLKERREILKEEKRIEELTKLKEKIQRKEERCKQILNKNYTHGYCTVKETVEIFEDTVKTKTTEAVEDLQNSYLENSNTDLNTHSSNSNLQLPPIFTKLSAPKSASSTRKDAPKSTQLTFAASKMYTESDGREEMCIEFEVRRSRSDTVGKNESKVQKGLEERIVTDTEIVKRKRLSAKKRSDLDFPPSRNLSSWKKEAETVSIDGFDSSTTLTSAKNTCVSVPREENSELQKNEFYSSDDNFVESDTSELGITMSSTMIVPERDTHYSQWISFNGDNEPVLNTSPEVDEGCDTFLKRLQRTKLINQDDPALPSGQQFCFEAMVDKRYNRWKRRRRKKRSEARRTNVAQNSESSDEDDDRNAEMEKIIDKMYEEIHGPVPQTPNGSRDTPRSRNRRRRKEAKSAPKVQEDNDTEEQLSSISLYEVSSEWTSDGALPSSSSVGQIEQPKVGSVTYEPEQETPKPSGSGTLSDDLCSWPYLEQYRTEILKRLTSRNSDRLEDQNDWLPEIRTPENGIPGDSFQEKCNLLANQENGKFYLDELDGEPENIPEKCSQENIQIDTIDIEDEHENVREEINSTEEQQQNADNNTVEYEPYIRVEETPRQSPCQVPAKQIYSYTNWLRSQRPARKLCSSEQKLKPLSRTNANNWSEMGYDQGFPEGTDTISAGDTSTELLEFRPIINQETIPCTKERLAKKSQKVALNIKKHNVNLPSLTKNSRSQTLPDTSGKTSREKLDRPAKVKQKSTKTYEEKPKTQTPRNATPTKSTLRETQIIPEFLFKDYYLRSLYGDKRINSHVDSKKTDKTLRKTLTVDNLEILAKRPAKKTEVSKPNELSFTRSFTFSMFDLPEMYKLYNTNLERRANGEEIVTQE
ncbi:uncharacterized protein LOC123530058 isoform X2 [Mercenaria mercenaria]|uniref:uncharacterized protein LOC123530058 isoform X2 n=1 Tax=Mercenaria mercenaria TaxID=6596 RepID=UPI00234E917B|nr:uncharacterized protein LOC123530058 isoform X2 [Mercenaria mercenaria]